LTSDDGALTYSICMLCSNDGETVKESLDSVLDLSRLRRAQVVVVDNMSSDGSRDVLRQYDEAGLIRLIERKCSRGEGRELAFRSSTGDYVLAHMDCDDVFDATGLNLLIERYHLSYEGKLLMTQKKGSDEASNITIAPRSLLTELGGWRDLNWGEDWDLWARANGRGKYAYLKYPLESPPHRRIKVRYGIYEGPLSRLGMRSHKYSDAIKTGRRMFKTGERMSASQRLAYFLAKAGVTVRREYMAPVPNPDFSEFSEA
jgi:glycosyltransferase involved in cell wall biosynthesis